MSFLVALITAFVVGVIAVVAVEAAVLYYMVRRIIAKSKSMESVWRSPPRNISDCSELNKILHKQGVVWILEPQKVPRVPVPGEHSRKKEFVEVFPVPRSAAIKGKYLVLTDSDGSQTKMLLKGCKVLAISSTGTSSRKWNKRYPIKVESSNVLHVGSKVLYVFLETSWEKESWCKALRLASSDHNESVDWFSKVSEDFCHYLRALSEGNPSFVKPSGFKHGPLDKASRLDPAPSKVRHLLKKITRRASKSSAERKISNAGMEDNSSSSTRPVDSGSNVSEVPDPGVYDKIIVDEGALCWNLLISRMFFDAKSNIHIKNSLKERIQRTLSNMRTPSYIGAMTCTEIDPGNLPPYIRNMRTVPTDMKEMWAVEMDVEYNGDMMLFIEVRLDVHDKNFQIGTIDPNAELSSADGMETDILQGFEDFGDDLNSSDGTIDLAAKKNEGNDELERVKSLKSGGTTAASQSKWKSIMNSVAKQVSQVPFMLAIRVASLKGTMQLRIKPPPSDQLWFGFTFMPDVDFHLESFVAEHKITSAHITVYLVNRLKAALRESLVLPNCESLCVPWMLAEKDDWAPKSAAPFVWLKRDVPTSDLAQLKTEACNNAATDELKTVAEAGEVATSSNQEETSESDSLEMMAIPASSMKTSLETTKSLSDLNLPLLLKDDTPGHTRNSVSYVSLKDTQNRADGEDEEDDRPKKAGRKARMLDLGKKMSGKFEEKGRHIVDKMRRQ